MHVARKSKDDFNYVSALSLHSAATFLCVTCGNGLKLERNSWFDGGDRSCGIPLHEYMSSPI